MSFTSKTDTIVLDLSIWYTIIVLCDCQKTTMCPFNTNAIFFSPQLVSNVSVVLMYVIEIGCLLLSVLGVFGAWKGKRWCLILVKTRCVYSMHNAMIFFHPCRTVCLSVQWFLQMMLLLLLLIHVCLQYATGMAAASQTIIVRTALSYQDIYEVHFLNALFFSIYNMQQRRYWNSRCVSWYSENSAQCDFPPRQKRVVREETKLLSLMPLSATSKANRTLLYSIQEEVSSHCSYLSIRTDFLLRRVLLCPCICGHCKTSMHDVCLFVP